MQSNKRVPLIVLLGLVAAALLVFGGFYLGASPGGRDALHGILPASYANTDNPPQNEVLRKLEGSYYKAVDPANLQEQAIKGMVSSLSDPYTVYFDAKETADFKAQESGSYSGVGMVMEMVDRFATIVSVFQGSPADLAGIKPGDVIVAINGASTKGMILDDISTTILGTAGTKVELTMYRPAVSATTTTITTTIGEGTKTTTTSQGSTTTPTSTPSQTAGDPATLPAAGTTKQYSLVRATISVPATKVEMLSAQGKQVALIHFYSFSAGSAAELKTVVQKAVNTDKVAAIILDLRGNGGGYLNEGIDVASLFIESGTIVSTSGLHSPEQVYKASGGAFTNVPLYVLVDRYTASASEIVSGALQDYKRATLIGETTFGKGLVQSLEPLSNGGLLKVTSAVYLTPNGRNINKKGITPDVVAPEDPATPDVDNGVNAALKLIEAGTTATTSTTSK